MNMNQDKHLHADGWTSDETFRSMRRACEQYKKKDKENIQLKQENLLLKKEIESLKLKINKLEKNKLFNNNNDDIRFNDNDDFINIYPPM